MATYSRFPDFFIVGAQRSGTTSLYEYLARHPQVFMSSQKETHYFSQDLVRVDGDLVVRSEREYLNLFSGAEHTAVLGEASPSYLWHPLAAERIFKAQPHAKIIVSLRDPIARAFSQYQMDLADGLRPISFHDLIERDYYRGEKIYGTGRLYIELGKYAEQVKRYMDVFGPSAVLVIAFDDLSADPRRVMGQVAEFLDIQAAGFEQVDTSQVYNRNTIPHSSWARRVLPHRSLRQAYRALMPRKLRRNLRDRIFDSSLTLELDVASFEFLHKLYAAEVAKVEALCQISFPSFAQERAE